MHGGCGKSELTRMLQECKFFIRRFDLRRGSVLFNFEDLVGIHHIGRRRGLNNCTRRHVDNHDSPARSWYVSLHNGENLSIREFTWRNQIQVEVPNRNLLVFQEMGVEQRAIRRSAEGAFNVYAHAFNRVEVHDCTGSGL